VHHVASKSAVIGVTRVLSRELGGNTLSEENPTPEILAMREAAVAARSLKRDQTPEDLVGAVLFLLSDEAAFITGQSLLVDGGTTLH
jgi:3-oxoacyl-[acyl-carrier protein] reductase